jgi:hypothetical protein
LPRGDLFSRVDKKSRDVTGDGRKTASAGIGTGMEEEAVVLAPLPLGPLGEGEGIESSAAPVNVITCPIPPTVVSTTPRSAVT